MLEIED